MGHAQRCLELAFVLVTYERNQGLVGHTHVLAALERRWQADSHDTQQQQQQMRWWW